MSGSSSRIMIAPVDGSNRLDNRLIDRLLGWWDHGGGKRLRRWCRTTTTSVRGHVANGTRAVGRRIADHPVGQRVAGWLAPVTRTTATLTRPVIDRASQALQELTTPAAPEPESKSADTQPSEPDRQRTRVTEVPQSRAPRRDAPTTRTARRPVPPRPEATTAESYTDQLAALVKSRDTTTRPTNAGTTGVSITPAPATLSDDTTGTTSMLRCWSCKRRSAVRSPRRGGCCRCTSCQAVMLVVDPVVGLTCDVSQASERGIDVRREANETDPG